MRYLLIALLFVSCTPSDYDQIKAENARLKAELEELKFGPGRMLAEGENLMYTSSFDDAKKKLNDLISKHPSSSEAGKAKELLAEIDRQEKVIEENKRQVLKDLVSSYDEVSGVTWYRDPLTTKYDNRESIHFYIGTKEGMKTSLRFRIQYVADNWLFIEKYTISVDGANYTYVPREMKRDNNAGKIWEYFDDPATESTIEICKAIAESKKTIIRHIGKYHDDREVTEKEKKALGNMIVAYEAMN